MRYADDWLMPCVRRVVAAVQAAHPPMRQLEIERRLAAGAQSSAHWDAVATVSADATAFHDRDAPAEAAALEFRVTAWSPYGRCGNHKLFKLSVRATVLAACLFMHGTRAHEKRGEHCSALRALPIFLL